MIRCLSLVVAAGLAACGCSKPQEFKTFSPADDVTNTEPAHDHHHHDLGPHGGHVVELGEEEYHAEVVLDEATRKLTVYLFGADGTTPHAIAEPSLTVNLKVGEQPAALTLTAEAQDGEAEGQSSQFVLAEGLPEAIKDAEDLHGEVVVTIAAKQYRGAIAHDHGHAH